MNEQISRVQSFLIKPTFTTNHKQEVHEVKRNTNLYIFGDYGGVRSCFACKLQFSTGYPWLGVPVTLVIVYLISYLKFT